MGCKLVIYHDMLRSPFIAPFRQAEDIMTLWVGEFLHGKIQEAFSEYYATQGILYAPETPVQIHRSCSGTADAQIIDGNLIFTDEYKSIGRASFDNLGRKPLDYHVDQLQLYMHGQDSDGGRIIYICRDNFYMKEYEVPREYKAVEKYLVTIDEIEDAVASGTPPEPKDHYLGRTPCTKICFYRELCPLAKKKTRRKL